MHRHRNLPSATKQPPKKLEFVVPPDVPLFPHLRVPKINTAPPKPVKIALWKFDKPTLVQDYCPESRVKPDDAHEINGVAPTVMLPAPQARPPVDMQRTTPIGYGFGFGHHTAKENVADLVAFANEWIPRIKRMKTEDGNRGNDSDHGET